MWINDKVCKIWLSKIPPAFFQVNFLFTFMYSKSKSLIKFK